MEAEVEDAGEDDGHRGAHGLAAAHEDRVDEGLQREGADQAVEQDREGVERHGGKVAALGGDDDPLHIHRSHQYGDRVDEHKGATDPELAEDETVEAAPETLIAAGCRLFLPAGEEGAIHGAGAVGCWQRKVVGGRQLARVAESDRWIQVRVQRSREGKEGGERRERNWGGGV